MRLRVVTDSSTNVPDDWRARLSIIEVPAVINFGSESFLKNELTLPEVYRRIEAAPSPPTTAQPSPQQFSLAYEQAAREGAEEIIAVVVSSEVSGTFNSAQGAQEHSPVPVHLFDARNVSMAAGWQAIVAAEMAEAGSDAASILARLGHVRDRMRIAFSPANLKYIIASGRVPRLRGTIGDLLHIKPIMMTTDGKLDVVSQVRSQRRASEAMLDLVLTPFGNRPLRVAVGHCNVPHEGAALHAAVLSRANAVESVVFDVGVVLAALAGPGLLGLVAYPLED
jgi:DegV family protein with EDD domain